MHHVVVSQEQLSAALATISEALAAAQLFSKIETSPKRGLDNFE
jgi:hypothetical protein